ncbi:MAG: hypothetical protein ACI84C_002008, partial [Flavobacteriales bacterium]
KTRKNLNLIIAISFSIKTPDFNPEYFRNLDKSTQRESVEVSVKY